MRIINLFCDASIDLETNIACAGCIVVNQVGKHTELITDRKMIQKNATNNSAEILAIWLAIREAIKLNEPGTVFRLFSDSKISLYGMRDWIKNWINNIKPDGTLVSTSGEPVANQQTFIDIYNMIVENNIKVEFYHQRGHVKDKNISLEKARADFIKANKVTPEALYTDISFISNMNCAIDEITRRTLYIYLRENVLSENTEVYCISPLIYYIRASYLGQYIRNINKTSVSSRHDFKVGYNQ